MGGWTSLFKRSELVPGDGGDEQFVIRLLDSVASILQGAQEEETFREIRAQLKELFQCDDVSLFFLTDEKPRPEEGEWVLRVRAGFGEGNRVVQADARAVPALQAGKRIVASDFLSEKAVLKAVALAFEEDCFYGCDIENKKVVLLKNPTPEDDMGSGDLSVLAIPLRHQAKVGRVVEKTRVGVLVLYKTPVRRDLADLERPLRTVLAHAVVAARCQLKDPVTSLFTEAFLEEELHRQMNLFQLTNGRLQGGFVVGHIDTLHLYKQTLEAAAAVDPAEISQRVSDVLRGVAACVLRRATDHALDAGSDYKCGYAGRVGHDGFGVILPRMAPTELCMWAQRLAKDVVDHPFQGEEMLPSGQVTVSLRVVPFGQHTCHTPEAVLKQARAGMEEVKKEQHAKRNERDALRRAVGSVLALSNDGRWVPQSELARELTETAPSAAPAAPVKQVVDGVVFVDEMPASASHASSAPAPSASTSHAVFASQAPSASHPPPARPRPPSGAASRPTGPVKRPVPAGAPGPSPTGALRRPAAGSPPGPGGAPRKGPPPPPSSTGRVPPRAPGGGEKVLPAPPGSTGRMPPPSGRVPPQGPPGAPPPRKAATGAAPRPRPAK